MGGGGGEGMRTTCNEERAGILSATLCLRNRRASSDEPPGRGFIKALSGFHRQAM